MSKRKISEPIPGLTHELEIHLIPDLSQLVTEYADFERYTYNDENIRVNYVCLYGEFHGTIDIYTLRPEYSQSNDEHTTNMFHRISFLFSDKLSSPEKENMYLFARYNFDHGILCGEQLHFNREQKVQSSHVFKNGRLNGPVFQDWRDGTNVGTYEDGRRHGQFTHTNKLRNFSRTGMWERGLMVGEWIKIKNGIEIIETYVCGALVRERLTSRGDAELATQVLRG